MQPSKQLCAAILAPMRRSNLGLLEADLLMLVEPALGRLVTTEEVEDAIAFCREHGWLTESRDAFDSRRYYLTDAGRALGPTL